MARRKKRKPRRRKKIKHLHDEAGIFIPAGLLMGLGIGGLYGSWGAGALLGLGAGFAALAISRLTRKR